MFKTFRGCSMLSKKLTTEGTLFREAPAELGFAGLMLETRDVKPYMPVSLCAVALVDAVFPVLALVSR